MHEHNFNIPIEFIQGMYIGKKFKAIRGGEIYKVVKLMCSCGATKEIND